MHRYIVSSLMIILAALGTQAAARRMLDDHDHDIPAGDHKWELATPLHNLTLANITGVWVGYGDQFSAAVWASYDNDTMLPDCAAKGKHGAYTYKHWNDRFPDTLAFAVKANATKGHGINGHEDGTYEWADVTYDSGLLRYTPDWAEDGKPSCSRLLVYIDNRNGMVYSKMISKSAISMVSGEKVYTDAPCEEVREDEVAGCYPQSSGAVHAVSVSTHKCTGGACLLLAPAWNELDH